MHGRQVPDVTDQRPAGHDVEEMGHHAMFAAIPESIAKPHIILKMKRNENSAFQTAVAKFTNDILFVWLEGWG